MKNICIFFAAIVLLAACSYSKPVELEGLDTKTFKADRAACKGDRKKQLEFIKSNKDAFLEISENVVYKTLGRYDFQGLGKKNEKFWVYFLEEGPQCEQIQNESDATCIILYFNAVKLVKEVIVQKGAKDL